jgi:hypothetical protein
MQGIRDRARAKRPAAEDSQSNDRFGMPGPLANHQQDEEQRQDNHQREIAPPRIASRLIGSKLSPIRRIFHLLIVLRPTKLALVPGEPFLLVQRVPVRKTATAFRIDGKRLTIVLGAPWTG